MFPHYPVATADKRLLARALENKEHVLFLKTSLKGNGKLLLMVTWVASEAWSDSFNGMKRKLHVLCVQKILLLLKLFLFKYRTCFELSVI